MKQNHINKFQPKGKQGIKYNHRKVENFWQKEWEAKQLYRAFDLDKRDKYYVLFEFPYPSGAGLHVGHLRPYVGTDVVARYRRMQGKNVLYPIGWDAFGLPTENYAIKNKIHPRVATDQNIKTFQRQMRQAGLSLDWTREIDTTDPKYYKWTQWIFLLLYKAGLAYRDEIPINWCPKCKTGLANEEVVNGKHERCGTLVEKKLLKQWVIKITKYADRLIEDLKLVDYPERVKTQQINWIGRSEGAEISFPLAEKSVKRFVLLHGRHGAQNRDFFPWLKKELEAQGYEVQIPDMPNTDEPSDSEQADFVEKNCRLDEHTVVLGHSFGGIVALRLLDRGIRLQSVIFAGTPASGKYKDKKPRPAALSAIKSFDFAKIKKNATRFVSISDHTDHVVYASDGEFLAKKLDGEYRLISAEAPHFHQAMEPELLAACLPSIKVFTTRPDTLFGATYLVLAPEHPIIENFKSKISNFKEVEKYVEAAAKKTDIQRTAEEKEKTGVELKGITAINPASGKEIPVWVADYVMTGYGTGAIMAVPAHDTRDFAFAKKYKLPTINVIRPYPVSPRFSDTGQQVHRVDHTAVIDKKTKDILNGKVVWSDLGVLRNSDKYSGWKSEDAISKITGEFGKLSVSYKLRDWIFSRQHYWGEPIPIVYCTDHGEVPVPEKDLPVLLPKVKNYEPTDTGESPLSSITSFVNTKCPICKKPARRETDTMPNWAGSNWYYLRYLDPKNSKVFADRKKIDYWMPVNLYNGGMEHTTLHLLYSRFIYKFLFDQGLVSGPEPYAKRTSNGVILSEDGRKMSKSFANVINPDDIINEYGADTLRMYEMFIAPFDQMVPWDTRGVVGVKRFLDKAYRVFQKDLAKDFSEGEQQLIHKLIKKITEDIEGMKFNTAVSAFMETLNKLEEMPGISRFTADNFLVLLAPFAPHLTEELWAALGYKTSIHLEPWPKFDSKHLIEDTLTIAIQVNGKTRDVIEVPTNLQQNEIENQALTPKVEAHIKGKTIVKTVYVMGRLVNFVVK